VADPVDRGDTVVDEGSPEQPGGLPTRQFERGASVGRYIMLDRLGGGGMGVVYAAYDPELDRKIAIKLLRATGAVDSRARLLREAQAMARLAHPNVIAVHDVGTVGDEVFIAMELVDGTPLSTFLGQERPMEEVLALFLQAGRGLAAAHAAGIIHRDFKPDNVLVDRQGRVRVLDFGLARAAGDEHVPSVAVSQPDDAGLSGKQALAVPLTRTGAFLGTPAYMAPEQMLGEATDARSDQFSFCIALYEALYGERPFAGDTLLALAQNVIRGEIRPPPRDNRVPARLRELLLRGLRTEREQRFPSMEALLEALAPGREAPSRWWLAAVGVVLFGAGVIGFRSARKQHQLVCRGAELQLQGAWDAPRRQAMQNAFARTGVPYAEDAFRGAAGALDDYAQAWAAMRTSACEATRLRGEQSEELLDLRMQCLDERRVKMGALVDLFTRADAQIVERSVQAARSLDRLDICANTALLKAPVRPPSDPRARAQVDELRRRIAAARALEKAGKYDEGLTMARPVVDSARALGYRPVLAEALMQRASLEYGAGKYKDAEQGFIEASAAAVAAHQDEVVAWAWTRLTWLVSNQEQRVEDAQRWALFAEAAVERTGLEELRGRLLSAQASLLHAQNKDQEALTLDQRAQPILEKVFGPEDGTAARGLNSIAVDLDALDRQEEGIGYLRRALAIYEKQLGPHHPDVSLELDNIGLGLVSLARWEEAKTFVDRALAIREKTLDPEHPVIAESLETLGRVLLRLKRSQEALPVFRRALAIEEKAFGPRSPGLTWTLTGLGMALIDLHESKRALAPLERAMAFVEANPPAKAPETRFALARALWETGGDRARAKKLAAQARDGFASRANVEHKNRLAAVDAWLAQH
jgi:tetratricopeptide (TPR) repeat protein